MKLLIVYILLLLYSTTVISQEPRFSWGEKIKRNFGQLENMKIVGVDEDGFFTTYQVNKQITLEHYSPQNRRFWTTALLPKTPDGHDAAFESVKMINENLFMFSSTASEGITRVYVQKIHHNGNYEPTIAVLAQSPEEGNILLATSANDAALAILITGPENHSLTLLTNELSRRWRRSVPAKGDVEDLLVQNDGTTYLLLQAPAAAPATTAYHLYKFERQTGNSSELVLGNINYRPLRAKLAATPDGHVLVTGFMSPSNSVASQNPEPVGTFLYRLEKHNLQSMLTSYTPFTKSFTTEYKRFKPDFDNSQRLRNLHLDKVIQDKDGSLYLLGEVCITENRAGTLVYHNNDIIITRLQQDGSMAFTISINKLQSGINKQNTIRSYFSAIVDDTLRLLYLNFEYNFKPDAHIALSGHTSTLKTPVIVNVHANGTYKATPLYRTLTGRDYGFYLRPGSAFKVTDKKYIVIGMGPEFYRYGQMSF
ncbi:hypothetical protein [uncultured Pontibacter sp.]|uniref:hypothetical protein n=1 Tax=uncultured Pontibacter sp. TaxID=453356 RepID=UPI00262CB294|nr:hypothetical protein [uncultured Pontibacter sp.]